MKTIRILKKSNEMIKISIPAGKFRSDTFLCSNCGCRAIKKVYGDTCVCNNCGGTMHRQ